MTMTRRLNKQYGVTIVELMVGLMLSLLLVGGVLQVYLGTKTTYEVTEGLSRLQESSRFSIDMLARDIRMAGYVPCSQPQASNSIVKPVTNDWWVDIFETPIKGFEGENGTTDFPADIASDAVAGSDAILILRSGSQVAGVNFYDAASNQFIMQRDLGADWVEDGSLMIACDSTNARLFQADTISSTSPTTVTVTDITDSTANPGNSASLTYAFGNDSQLANYSAVIYYISDAVSGDGYSLYRSYLNVNSSGVSTPLEEELIEGVESMQLLYGFDSTEDGIAERYFKADDATFNDVSNWQNVVTVRVGLLFASEDGLRDSGGTDSNTYIVANTEIGTSTTVTHAEDFRKRYVSSMTVSLRNI